MMAIAEARTPAAAERPRLLGVVNLSPESMVRDSIARGPEEALERARSLCADGVDIIDLGGRSITPDAPEIDDDEEQRRLAPTAKALCDAGFAFSVDTWSSDTARSALGWGASMINFTGGSADPAMLDAVAAAGASLVITHMPAGSAYELRRQPRPVLPDDLVGAILDHLAPRVEQARRAGVREVIVDPNLGIIHPETDDYEKIHLQLEIVWQTDRLRALGCPLLYYAARKPERLARIMMASAVLHAQPEYVRTHEPSILRELLRVAGVKIAGGAA